MPYDYYEHLKKQHENKDYTETTDIVRKKIWNETINFKISKNWLKIEDIILNKLYLFLRYT
ncbi:MAG: hypothetical protein E7Z80_08355 [Methanobrevibacter thaueri]|nr:hypothetical protein [Methanobrevibacter thaueri]